MSLSDSPRSGQTDLTSVPTESSAPHGRWPSPPPAECVGDPSPPSLGTGTHTVPILPEPAPKSLTCEDVLNFQACCDSAGKFLRLLDLARRGPLQQAHCTARLENTDPPLLISTISSPRSHTELFRHSDSRPREEGSGAFLETLWELDPDQHQPLAAQSAGFQRVWFQSRGQALCEVEAGPVWAPADRADTGRLPFNLKAEPL